MARVLAVAERHGIRPLIRDILDFARRCCVFPLIHAPSGTKIDVALALTPFETAAIQHAQVLAYSGVSLPVPRPEDLIVMKAVANRPQDHADIDTLLSLNPKVDIAYIRRWVREFARIAESPDIVSNLERLIAAQLPARAARRRRRKRT